MNLNKYDIFCKTADLHSLTKAAAAMGITQSAVSHIIADLEKEFGCPLLVRSRAGTRLTAEGERLLPFLRAVVAAEERLRREAAELHSPKAGVVRIGAFTSVAVHWLPGILKQFQKAWPEVEIRLLNGDYQDVNTWLAEGSVDVGFVTLPTDLGCRTMPLMSDRLLAVLPPEHPLAAKERVNLRDLSGESFISLLEGSNQDARRALEAAGVSPAVRYVTKDDYAIIAMLYDPKIAQEFARRMLEKGVYVVGFCYPVVPKGRDRIRTQISAGHTKEDLDFAIRCFGEVKKEMGI